MYPLVTKHHAPLRQQVLTLYLPERSCDARPHDAARQLPL